MQFDDVPFVVTEWAWLKLKLEMHALRWRSANYGLEIDTEIHPDSGDRRIICTIQSKIAQKLVERQAPHRDQLILYWELIEKEKESLAAILRELPTLGQTLDFDQDVTFVITYSYGTGTATVCECVGSDFVWK